MWGQIKRRIGVRQYSYAPALVLFLIFIGLNSVISSNFLTVTTLAGIAETYAPLVVLAVAETFVLIGGGIDISLGATVSLVNVLLVVFWGYHWPMIVASVAAIGVGVLVGVINATLVALLNVTPLLATFATSTMAFGAALWVLPTPGGSISTGFADWYAANIWVFPTPLVFMIGAYLCWWLWKRSVWGVYLYALGRSEEKSLASGAPNRSVKMASYVIAALLAGFAALAVTGNTVSGDATIGSADTLSAIAAPVIGGVSLMGGSGDAGGAIFGALFLALIVNTVFASQVGTFYQNLLSGIIILLGIVITVVVKRITTNFHNRKVVEGP